jgi:membrane protein implicated in regulation of membrane protease activity
MGTNVETWLWLAGGVALLVSELFHGGLVAVFLGAGALTVAALRALGLVESTPASLVTFAASSALYVVVLRSALVRAFGKPEKYRESVSDERRAFGAVVEVVTEVTPDGDEGRIRFDGTSWPAKSMAGTLPAGGKARIVHRDAIGWVVESASAGDLPLIPPPPDKGHRR